MRAVLVFWSWIKKHVIDNDIELLWLSRCDRVIRISSHLRRMALFVIVVTTCLTSLMVKIFILQTVQCMSRHQPHRDVSLTDD